MAREIPGFYYDEIKKKYFKIEQNHVAVPGAQYSADAVKRRKLEDEDAKIQEHLEKLEIGRIRRGLTDPLLGGVLRREHGQSSNPSTAATQAYVLGWEGTEILPAEWDRYYPGGAIGRARIGDNTRPLLTTSTVTIAAFDWDPVTRVLFLDSGGQLSEIPDSTSALSPGSKDNTILYRRRDEESIYIANGVLNSINFDPVTRSVLTTWETSGLRYNNLHKLQLTHCSDPKNNLYNYHGYHDFANSTAWTITGPLHNLNDTGVTIWTSTPAPAASPYSFAVGTSRGIVTFSKNTTGLKWLQSENQRRQDSPDYEFFALEFMTQNPSILMAGKRNGHVDVLDLRLPQAQYKSGFGGIFHPSSISHVKEVNEYQVVVCGLESTLFQYDLRFCRTTIEHNRSELQSKRRVPQLRSITTPLFVYEGHKNRFHRDAGFAVDNETGLVAVAQVDDAKEVKVFSSATGEIIRSLNAAEVGSSIDLAYVKAMRFIPDRGYKGMKSLWVAKGTKMVRFAW